MFNKHLDYSFYRNDVVVEDQIFNMHKMYVLKFIFNYFSGLRSLMTHLGTISVVTQFIFPYIRAEVILKIFKSILFKAITITPMIEDGTVRLRWRLLYITWLQFVDFRNFKAEFREKNVSSF